jgi:hypothetical protein
VTLRAAGPLVAYGLVGGGAGGKVRAEALGDGPRIFVVKRFSPHRVLGSKRRHNRAAVKVVLC